VFIVVISFLISALDGRGRSISRPDRFIPGETDPGTHWRGGWVGLRDGLDAVAKRKDPFIAHDMDRTPIV